jgi:hypothetical protein
MIDDPNRHEPDPLFQLLADLPNEDVRSAAAERIRHRAHAVLVRRRRRAHAEAGAEAIYSWFLRPSVVFAVGGMYVAWGLGRALTLIVGSMAILTP